MKPPAAWAELSAFGLEVLRAERHCLGNVVPEALTFPGELVDRLTDAGAHLLILFGRPLSQIPGRIGHTLAKLGGESSSVEGVHNGTDARGLFRHAA